jgi:hypothetical protein
MKLGFNSNLRIRDTIYHVQTEDRGSEHPYIDTIVLSQGQVLHRRSTTYQDLLAGGAADAAMLLARVEQQHQDILNGLQAGSLALQSPAAGPSGAIEVKVHNVQWLGAGRALLELEVSSRGDAQPIAGADVVVAIEGAAQEAQKVPAQTDIQGRARVEFRLPEFADAGAVALLIEARAAQGQNHLRYRLKPKTRGSVPPNS